MGSFPLKTGGAFGKSCAGRAGLAVAGCLWMFPFILSQMSRIKVLLKQHLSLLSAFSFPSNSTNLQFQLNVEFCLILSLFVRSLVFFFPKFDVLQCSGVNYWAGSLGEQSFWGQAVAFVYSTVVGGLWFAGVFGAGREESLRWTQFSPAAEPVNTSFTVQESLVLFRFAIPRKKPPNSIV